METSNQQLAHEIRYLPNEPTRFSANHLDTLLAFCETFNVSDITIQTGEPIFAEAYGRLMRITNRKLSNTEVGDILNAIYGPNGTTQILSGRDVDTHYEFRPTRSERCTARWRSDRTATSGSSTRTLIDSYECPRTHRSKSSPLRASREGTPCR